MPSITLELPVTDTVVSAGLHATNYADIQALLNGALDGSNIAASTVLGITSAVLSGAAGLELSGAGGKDTLNLSNTTLDTGITIGGDVNLYRSAVNVLTTDDNFRAVVDIASRFGSTTQMIMGFIAADTPGLKFGNAEDTNLYRFTANTLKTDDAFSVGPITAGTAGGGGSVGAFITAAGGIFIAKATPATTLIAGGVVSDANFRFQVISDGSLNWGDGTSATDTNLYRLSANILKTDDRFDSVGGFVFNPGAAAGNSLVSIIGAEANSRFLMDFAGGMLWGAGGASAHDISLGRAAANIIQLGTGDALNVGGATDAGGNYIQFFEQTADPAAGAANTARLFSKDNGSGKTQLVVRFPSGATQVISTEP